MGPIKVRVVRVDGAEPCVALLARTSIESVSTVAPEQGWGGQAKCIVRTASGQNLPCVDEFRDVARAVWGDVL